MNGAGNVVVYIVVGVGVGGWLVLVEVVLPDVGLYVNSRIYTTLVIYLLWWGCWGGESLLRLNDAGNVVLILWVGIGRRLEW